MPPIAKDFPDHFETERLIVRAPRAGDGPLVYAATVETLDALRQWPASLPWATAEPSLESAETFCRNGQINFAARTDLPMLIFSKADGSLVGCTGLHRMDMDASRLEVGYWCRTSRAGLGFITEAIKGLVTYARQELSARRLEILTDAQNTRSRLVAERAGFILEGIQRNDRRAPDGSFRDTCVYAMTAPASRRTPK
jgi:RimJ/RimL family protein N-acetyltransferase